MSGSEITIDNISDSKSKPGLSWTIIHFPTVASPDPTPDPPDHNNTHPQGNIAMAYNSDRFDLTNWKITLPVSSSGSISGTAVEVKNLINYENSSYFYDAPDGAMVFRAMAEGATTSGSKYARSELREMVGEDRAAWKLSQGGTMTATVSVDTVPSRNDGEPGRLIVGQIHGQDEELVRLYYEGGKVYFVNDRAGSKNTETTFRFKDSSGNEPSIALGEKFSYMIDARGDKLTVKIFADGKEYVSTSTINSVWQSDSFYFKAGVYLGVNETTGKGFGQTSFYGLDFSHKAGDGLDGWRVGSGSTPPKPDDGDGDTGGNTPPPSDGDGDEDTETPPTGNPDPKPQPDNGTVTLNGDGGSNTISGGGGSEVLWGRAGNDLLNGGNGNDYLWGNEGNDTLIGGLGNDSLKGGPGADTYVIRHKGAVQTVVDFSVANKDKLDLTDVLKGALGFKNASALKDGFVQLTQNGSDVAVHVDLDGHAGSGGKELVAVLQNASAGKLGASSFLLPGDSTATPPVTPPAPPTSGEKPGDLSISGNSSANKLQGGAGNDVIRGQAGNDTILGGSGDDFLWGNEGNDHLQGGLGADTIKGGDGRDTYVFESVLEGGDTILDFRDGEKIDLSGIVETMLGNTSISVSDLFKHGYLSMEKHSATSAELRVDADGHSGAAQATSLATIITQDTDDLDASIFLI